MDGHRLKAEEWKRCVNKTVTKQTKGKCYGNFLNGCAFIRSSANNEQPAINSEPALFCNEKRKKGFILVIFGDIIETNTKSKRCKLIWKRF